MTNCFQCPNMIYITGYDKPYKCIVTGNRLDLTETDDPADFLYLPKWCPLRQQEAVQ